MHVQACGRFVKDVERSRQVPFAEFAGYLDALRFTARKCRGGLAELEIFQTDLREDVEAAHERRMVGKEFAGLPHGHGEDVRDVLAPVFDLKVWAL